jgi:hypothetical protein
MSTRCQIGIYSDNPEQKYNGKLTVGGEKTNIIIDNKKYGLKNFEALLYKHSDGYPSGMLPDIIPFLRFFEKARGISDTEYVAARLLQWLCNISDKDDLASYKNYPLSYPHMVNGLLPFTGILSHGICKDFHGDIEYFYAIYPSGINVYSCGFDKPCEEWQLLGSFNITEDGSSLISIEEAIKICEKSEVRE